MRLELTLDNLLYKDICMYCEYRGLEAETYIASLVADGHNVNKFGAVPPMFRRNPATPSSEEAQEAPPVALRGSEPPKRLKPQKTAEPPKGQEGGEVSEPKSVEQQEKPKRRRKTIAAK